jgi:hypothetical protein
MATAQVVGSQLYRRVAPENLQEYLKRETTYWKPWAENEVKKGNLTFWAVLVRIDGANRDTEPNILIVNNYKDIDKGANWAGVADMFPNVKMEDIQTQTLSTDTDQIFVRGIPGNTIRKENAVPENDFKFIRLIYHNVKDLGKHLAFEADSWKPLVEKAIKEGKTTMTGWGNGVIILPESEDFNYQSFSYDLFPSAQAALGPGFSEGFTFPEGFWAPIDGNYAGPRNGHLYRIVAVASAN